MKKITEIRQLRIKAGFRTAKEAATQTKTPYRTWQNWEAGKHNPPDVAYAYLEQCIGIRALLGIR